MLADYTGSALGLYHALAAYQPVHYGALIDFTPAMPDMPIILSRSPELFFHLSANGDITTRPMKGTIPRGATLWRTRSPRISCKMTLKTAPKT